MDKFKYATKRLTDGASYRQIGRELNVHHSTVSYWIKNGRNANNKTVSISISDISKTLSPEYSYILGAYLGDGYINKISRTYRLRIFNSIKYDDIIVDQKTALKKLFPNNKVVSFFTSRDKNCIAVSVHNSSLPLYFPQHGVGMKHTRNIILEDWQQDIINREPECFVKGLIDSDGSYGKYSQIINGTKYFHERYQFTNKSVDIINFYMETMKMLGIETRLSVRKSGVMNALTVKKSEVNKIHALYNIAESKIRTTT